MSGHQDADLYDFLRRALRPLARFCIRRGLKIQGLIESIKLALLDVAQEELQRAAEGKNISKLAVLTGLQRKDVHRLLAGKNAPHEAGNIMINVIGAWQQSARFRTAKGKPRKLEFEGTRSEFSELVFSVSKDLSPYTILFELERIGAIKKKNGLVELVVDTYVPKKDAVKGLQYLAEDIGHLVRGVEQNIFFKEKIPNHHVTTHFDNIAIESIPKIKEWLLKEGAMFHKRARDFIAQFDSDINPRFEKNKKVSSAKVTLGSFSRIEMEEKTGNEN